MREFTDSDGTRWRVEAISHGGTSRYLNPKVHQPILQFSCIGDRRARRYVGHPSKGEGNMDTLSEAELRDLLQRAAVH